ncbi:MAG TPA: hypothetical protein VKV23_02875 [Acidimicrobiales bacterium]|nr:hypothetical protein [Acidimicrobiales bacterium]
MAVTVVEQREATPTPVEIGGPRGGPPLSSVLRRDRWRVQPIAVAAGLLGFIGYSIWAALRNGDFYAGSVGRDYLSPYYSPCLTHSCVTAGYVWGPLFGDFWRISPAWLILIFPGAFRTTCYYYRKAYYRSLWLSPPACAVPDAGSQRARGLRRRYTGETRFPLVLQNIHRYTWYFAVIFAGILTWDAITAFRFRDGVGLGVGTLIFVANAVLIWAYTLGCHACRHLCGGGLKRFSRARLRYFFWKNVSTPLNEHHQLWAWCSLFSIVVTDLYTWLVASGTIHDPRII